MKIVVFGIGIIGKQFIRACLKHDKYDVVGKIDNSINVEGSIPVESVRNLEFDKIVITVLNKNTACVMKNQLLNLEVEKEKIEWIFDSNELTTILYSISCYPPNDIRVNWINSFAKFVYENNMDGNVVECGVNRGDLSMYINEFFPNKKLYLFDTFEGFHIKDMEIERGINDENFIKGSFNKSGWFEFTSEKLVISRMPHKENCIIKKGYFPETAIGIDNEKFCFVNLDMDLYNPQLEGIRFFYDKMIPGGVILLHDFYHSELPGVRKAVEVFLKENKDEKITMFPIGDNCSLAIIK